VVSSTPRPHFTPEKDPVPILQEAGWAPGPVLAGGKSRPQRDSIPDRPARSSVAIATELPGPPCKFSRLCKSKVSQCIWNSITTLELTVSSGLTRNLGVMRMKDMSLPVTGGAVV